MFFRASLTQDIQIIDNLLKDIRVLRDTLPENKACEIKFNNSYLGISESVQQKIGKVIFKINQGHFNSGDKETLLKIIDLLTLYSNHLDQQSSDKENPKLERKVKEEKVLSWLNTAYQVAKQLVPNLDELIMMEKKEQLFLLNQETLSSLSLMLHYLGKATRYNPQMTVQQRLPLLMTALSISRFLEESKDIHYYSGRIATFEAPVIFCFRQLGMHQDARIMAESQLKKAYAMKNIFHMIQGNVQLSEIMREQFEAQNTGIQEAILYAEEAIQIAKENTSGNFTGHCIYFNARVAAMKAYYCAGEKDKAVDMAEAIYAEYEQNNNCGAKPWHVETAQEILVFTTSCVM